MTIDQEIYKDFQTYIQSIKPFTVSDMKKVLEGLPDNMQILLGATDGDTNADWYNISHEVGVPDAEQSNYSALTLFPRDDYDSRQF